MFELRFENNSKMDNKLIIIMVVKGTLNSELLILPSVSLL